MAKARGTDGSLLTSLPWTLAALAFAFAPHVPFVPAWITGAIVACAAWRYVIEKRRRTLPATWVRAMLALVCFLGVRQCGGSQDVCVGVEGLRIA